MTKTAHQKVRDEARGSSSFLPANLNVVIEVTDMQKAVMTKDIEGVRKLKAEKEAALYTGDIGPSIPSLFKGTELELKEAKKDLKFKVLAVPVEFINNKERAACLPGDYVVLAKVESVELTDTEHLISSRSILAVCVEP